jgi:hypothetical protein
MGSRRTGVFAIITFMNTNLPGKNKLGGGAKSRSEETADR